MMPLVAGSAAALNSNVDLSAEWDAVDSFKAFYRVTGNHKSLDLTTGTLRESDAAI